MKKPGRKPQTAGDKKVVCFVLWRQYGQLMQQSFLAPGSARRKAAKMTAQGYTVQFEAHEIELRV